MRNQTFGLSKYIPLLLSTFLSIKKRKNEKAMRTHDLYTFFFFFYFGSYLLFGLKLLIRFLNVPEHNAPVSSNLKPFFIHIP